MAFNVAALRKAFTPFRREIKTVDPRRFWRGEDVSSPRWNVPIFSAANLSPQCITFDLESRDAVRVSGEVEFGLQGDGLVACRIGVAGKTGAGIEGAVKGKVIFRVTDLGDEKWHDLRFEITLPAELTVRSLGPVPVAVSHPIVTKLAPDVARREGPRNVIILMLDSIAADLLARYQERHGAESAIHRFFKSGSTFTNAFSQSEWTYPSIYSLMTGKAPLAHGCFERFLGQGMPDDATGTLAQELCARDFVTLCFSTSKMYHPAYNAHLGFHRFMYQPFGDALSFPVITQRALAHLESHRDCRNFLFLDYIDLHAPWSFNTEITDSCLPLFRVADPNREYETLMGDSKDEVENLSDAAREQLIGRCIARIRDVDLSLDTLFSYLERTNLADDALVLLLADHGDLFRRGNQPLLCRSRTHVPFMLRGSNIPAATYNSFVSAAVDVLPTLLNLVDGVAASASSDGRPVPPFGPSREFVISESVYENVYQAAVRNDQFVYHFSCAYNRDEKKKLKLGLPGTAKLFHVAEEELCRDVSEQHKDVVDQLNGHLFNYLAKFDVY